MDFGYPLPFTVALRILRLVRVAKSTITLHPNSMHTTLFAILFPGEEEDFRTRLKIQGYNIS